ncbi:hypothetical protein KUF54_06130 [Comamonas sp. Y33R10-2]|uniref:plasmid replication protein, CyRepA1 family n=1 Tax=Comamonas sp. Y33R10-2 TaxID=2853257 RepID=UPI001C5CBBE9|nr:plasmid replication protein, CyRepA1 family [Comamonas sp. Y33R10-2]QXZ10781.1 hypothetical protein KUF54_06130 [Comamonas sp. Y33R10-2]
MARFLDWCAATYTQPEDALAAYFEDAVQAAASVGATLDHLPLLDGLKHYVPNLNGRNDKKQFYLASIETDKDGTAWPAVTFKSFKGASVYWKPRDLAWQQFMAQRGTVAANDNDRRGYRAAAAAAIQAAKAKAAEHERNQAEGRTAAAAAALAAWQAATLADAHSYLSRKGVQAHGLRLAGHDLRARLWNDEAQQWQDAATVRAGDLLVPMLDDAGALVNIQRITPQGVKRFVMGGRAHGCHHRIDGSTVLVEGYATGATWHAATGDAVVIGFSAGALAAVAAYTKPDAIAADNDDSKTGEKAAKATGLPYHLPPLVGDWNDYAAAHGLEAVRAAVANDNAEAFTRPYALPLVELKGREQTWWNKLAAADDAAQAAALAWSIGRRLCVRVPVLMTLEALAEQIGNNTMPGALHPATLAAIVAALARIVDWRKRRAMAAVTMSAEATARHNVETVANLPTLTAEDYKGVLLLASPMGSGKTQRIGQPFSSWAKHQEARFLATCHRQSLVAELARVLACDHYQETPGEMAWSVQAMATCLPSIVKADHSQIIDEAGNVFIDEVAQVLRSIASKVTVADKKSRADVFHTLRELVSRAKCLIGADAGMDDRVLSFLESCRPGERFRIIQQPHRIEGLTVSYGFGPEALATAYGEAMARLTQGERLWIACGEKSRAIEAARILASTGARILLLHGDNKENAEQAAFWRDPEAISRDYDCVIANSVISSGLSIEHRKTGEHFTHGMFLGSGATITPADALQMLRRVRYLRAWTVAITPNNAKDIDNVDAILAGMEQAAGIEGSILVTATDFDAFVAGIEADQARWRADFAAGLWWALEHQGFTLERMAVQADAGITAELKTTRAAIREERRAAILAAADLDDAQARRLREKPSRTEAEQDALLRHRIKSDLCLTTLDGDALDIWDDGRGPRRMDRFSAATQRMAERQDHTGEDLALRRFTKARALAYSWLLEGVALAPGLRITQAVASSLVERVIERRYLQAFLGIVPAKWAHDVGTDLKGKSKPFPAPVYPVREVAEILERMGLELKRREFRFALTCPDISLEVITPCEGKSTRHYAHELTAESWERIALWADRRNKGRKSITVEHAQQIVVPAGEDERYWHSVRLELWQQSEQVTAPQALGRLSAALKGRAITPAVRLTRFWWSEVMGPRLAA